MAMFSDIFGIEYPVSRVVKIAPERGGKIVGTDSRRSVVYLDFMDDGVEVSSFTLGEIQKMLSPAIPAAPGFTLLTIWYDARDPDDSEPFVDEQAVIAWRLNTGNGTHPVTFDEGYDRIGLGERNALEDANGRIFAADESTFDNRQQWIENYKREADQAAMIMLDAEQEDGGTG